MRIRKAERETLEALLSQEATLDEMVEAVFDTVTGFVLARDWKATAVRFPGYTVLYGPFESDSVAGKAMANMTSPGPEPLEFLIRPLYKITKGE